MSIIEQATRRLEELKRAGVEVAWEPPAHAALHSGGHGRSALDEPGYVLDALDESTPGPAPGPSARDRAAGHALMRVGLRQSKSVELDLVKLSEQGYLVPGAARSALVDEFRAIKQPVLKNARALVEQAAMGGAGSAGSAGSGGGSGGGFVGGSSGAPNSGWAQLSGSGAASSSASHSGPSKATPPHANLIMVTSALAGEGKTFCAVNLALSIASEVDSSVLLVDADVLCPSVMTRLGVQGQHKGLLDLLSDASLTLPDLILKTNVPKLSVLPAGAPTSHSTELLASDALGELLHDIATRYPERIVIFDAPPLLSTTESRVLATRMGQIIMVVGAEQTQSLDLAQAFTALEHCPTVFSVLNRCSDSSNHRYYG